MSEIKISAKKFQELIKKEKFKRTGSSTFESPNFKLKLTADKKFKLEAKKLPVKFTGKAYQKTWEEIVKKDDRPWLFSWLKGS